MALLRGDDNWASDPTKFHSYLLWWESRNEFCNETPKFHGALYGWRPNANSLSAYTMTNAWHWHSMSLRGASVWL